MIGEERLYGVLAPMIPFPLKSCWKLISCCFASAELNPQDPVEDTQAQLLSSLQIDNVFPTLFFHIT